MNFECQFYLMDANIIQVFTSPIQIFQHGNMLCVSKIFLEAEVLTMVN